MFSLPPSSLALWPFLLLPYWACECKFFSLVICLQTKYPPAAAYICVLGWLLRAASSLMTQPSMVLSLVQGYGSVDGLTGAQEW